MEKQRFITTTHIDWQGITLSVTYEPNWLNMDRTCQYATRIRRPLPSLVRVKTPLRLSAPPDADS